MVDDENIALKAMIEGKDINLAEIIKAFEEEISSDEEKISNLKDELDKIQEEIEVLSKELAVINENNKKLEKRIQ